jgi:hypothetical protein
MDGMLQWNQEERLSEVLPSYFCMEITGGTIQPEALMQVTSVIKSPFLQRKDLKLSFLPSD